MTAAAILARLVLTDATGTERKEIDDEVDIDPMVLANGKREQITLANGFTALAPPTGSNGVIIRFISGAFTFTLKGITGDTGIALSHLALAAVPILLPLGTTPSIGITCTGAGVVECYWF